MVMSKHSVDRKHVQTMKPGGTKGVKVQTQVYWEIARAIFQYLSWNEEVTTVDLLSQIEDDVQVMSNESFVYFALHIKLDLESRGYLKLAGSKTNPRQIQKYICMTKTGWRYFKSMTK
jgi:hypothetical protein